MNAHDFPENLDEFAFMPRYEAEIDELANVIAEHEDWNYKNSISPISFPVLKNYLRYTYKRVAEETKIKITTDEFFCCWNTGLITANQESIYALYSKNPRQNVPTYWEFKKFSKNSDRDLNVFGGTLPEMAHYFDDPSALIYDSRKELVVNIDHVVDDNFDRFPENLRNLGKYALKNMLFGAIEGVKERVRRNYKTGVPQYYYGKIQLLLPLCLTDPSKADVALVVDIVQGGFYRGNTILPLDWAYNNARQLAKPDKDWLQP